MVAPYSLIVEAGGIAGSVLTGPGKLMLGRLPGASWHIDRGIQMGLVATAACVGDASKAGLKPVWSAPRKLTVSPSVGNSP